MSKPTPLWDESRVHPDYLLVLPCSDTKVPDAGTLPAYLRYDGPMYRVLRKRLRAGRPVPRVVILSALHGVLGVTDEIATYDLRMNRAAAARLLANPEHAANFRSTWTVAKHRLILCGQDYLGVLQQWIRPDESYEIDPGGIGMKLRRMAEYIDTLPDPAQPPLPASAA